MKNPLLEKAKELFGENVMAVGSIYSMTFDWVDPTLEKELGYTPEELTGMSARKIVDIDYSKLLKLAADLMSAKQKKEIQPMIKKDGTVVNAEGIISAFTYEKEPFIAFTDVKLLTDDSQKKEKRK